jgi:hypothetical protein
MAAFPRAETRLRRSHLIHVLGYVTPKWNFDVLWALERVARDDPDEVIRRQAEDVCEYLRLDDEDDEDSW